MEMNYKSFRHQIHSNPQLMVSYPQTYPQQKCLIVTGVEVLIHIIHNPYYHYYYLNIYLLMHARSKIGKTSYPQLA